jgi:hypothetical protein
MKPRGYQSVCTHDTVEYRSAGGHSMGHCVACHRYARRETIMRYVRGAERGSMNTQANERWECDGCGRDCPSYWKQCPDCGRARPDACSCDGPVPGVHVAKAQREGA